MWSPAPAQVGLGTWVLVLLLAPGLLVVIGTVLAYLVRRRGSGGGGSAGAGYYHILGIDRGTSARREITVHADSRSGAIGQAQFQGIVVTEVTRVKAEED